MYYIYIYIYIYIFIFIYIYVYTYTFGINSGLLEKDFLKLQEDTRANCNKLNH